MTDPETRAIPEGVADLCGRLKAKVDSGRRTLGGGSVGVMLDGKPTGATFYGNEPIMVLRNPDGFEAATALKTLAAENARLREALEKIAAFKVAPEYGDWADKADHQGYNRAGKYASGIARAALSPVTQVQESGRG